MPKVVVNAEKLRWLRVTRVWTQERLAEVARVGVRTVQRIEATGAASFDSIQQIAQALEVEASELMDSPDTAKTKKTPKTREPIPVFLNRLTSGADVFRVLEGAHGGDFGNDNPVTREEADLVGAFMQDMHGYLDVCNEIEPGQRVQTAFEYTARIQELTNAGFSVFGASKCLRLRSQNRPDQVDQWTFAIIQVLRSDNPRIVKHQGLVETVSYLLPPALKFS